MNPSNPFNAIQLLDSILIQKTILTLVAVLVIGLIGMPAYAASPGSPLDQFNSGTPLNMIQCSDDKLLMQSPSGKPMCLTADSAVTLTDRGYTKLVTFVGDKPEINDKVALTTTPTLEPQITTPTLEPQITTPTLEPQITTPTLEPQITTPTLEPQITTPTLEPQITTPTLEPQITTPTLEPQITTLQIASPEPFVDDGRVFPIVLQGSPSPYPLYDKIMGYDLIIGNHDASGSASIASPPHDKYSLNPGEGLYIEDWMPTYIIPGYQLLYANSDYVDYSTVHDPPRSTEIVHVVKYYYVPNGFVLYENATSALFRQSDGYSTTVHISSTPHDEIEDGIERARESRASQSGDYSEFREMTRDGKTVFAYQGGNDLNYYTALLSFQPDEYTIVRVNSNYHNLDELIPVFESIMK